MLLRKMFLVVAAVAMGACTRTAVPLRPAQVQPPHNPASLGAPWSVVATALGPPVSPPVSTASTMTGTVGRCPSGAAAFVVEGAIRPQQPPEEAPVVEIDATSCAGALTIEQAVAQAKKYFPDLSGVVRRQAAAVVYSSQPLIRLVPAASFFVCQALGASATRLGRFSVRLEPNGWKLAVGDCVSDAPPGSPAAQ
ncbi:MAG: hypothetical protein JOZ37_02715 [Actinobacteria bacterium]|nr:hypothetical protein [Actinomycetota bacterium]MBV9935445.1 hypothetical protein [Actinomycetota bacterium]